VIEHAVVTLRTSHVALDPAPDNSGPDLVYQGNGTTGLTVSRI